MTQRYTMWCGITHGHALLPGPKGHLVSYEDYAKLLALATFGARCLDEMREDGGSDIDGGWAQDVAVECGLLQWVDVTEPCDPESCACAGYGDFPQKCLRRTDAAKAMDVPVTQEDLDEADAYADDMVRKLATSASDN